MVYIWSSSGSLVNGSALETNYSKVSGGYAGSKCYEIPIPSGAIGIKIKYKADQYNSGNYMDTGDVDLQSNLWNNSSNMIICQKNTTPTYGVHSTMTTIPASFDGPDMTYGSGTENFSAKYQPEDRYGMISDINHTSPVTDGLNDSDNFIRIITALDNPYIMFYSDDDVTTTIGGNSKATAGISLTAADQDGTQGSPYMIRLPKDARALVVSSGYTTAPDTSKKQLLFDDNVTTTVGSGANTSNVTVPYDYHHAGTTFNVDSNGNVSVYSLRSGFTTFKNSSMTDPLNPKTDYDYIYFTDTSGFANDGTVYAYFYGGPDGEFNAWPGVKASAATESGKVSTTYKDNDGNTVYVFRVPRSENGVYRKVIFNNGAEKVTETGKPPRKITEAMTLTAGTNYKLGTTLNATTVYVSAQVYGTFAPRGQVYLVTPETKAESATASYSTGGKNDYIYIINNGTYGFGQSDGDMDANGRYILDDIHVEFFDAINMPVGTASPGYIPDKVGTKGSYDVYRIQVPSDAKTFIINNGQGKGNATLSHNHDRHSEQTEIIPDALYKFVTEEPYIVGTTPTSVATLSTPAYKLTIDNKRTPPETDEELPDGNTVDIHLATVITGSNGTVEKITWLKDDPGHIDTNYLNHSPGDVNNTAVTQVNVKKQGDYYWKEIVAPSGYAKDTTLHSFRVTSGMGSDSRTFTDEANPTGTLSLSKKLSTVKTETDTNYGETKKFTFTVTLTAPAGTNWTAITQPTCSSGGTMTEKSTNGVVRTYELTVPATATNVTINNIPYGTYYNITENTVSDYIWVSTYKGSDTTNNISDPVTGTINSADNAPAYKVTNKHDVGMLTLKDIVVDRGENALIEGRANVNQPMTISGQDPEHPITVTNWYKYCYHVTLISPHNVDLNDYISKAYLDSITGYYDWIEDTEHLGTAIYASDSAHYHQPEQRANNEDNVQYTAYKKRCSITEYV